MQSVWRFSFKVRSYEGDRNGVLKPQALLNYFEEAAQQHARELGFGYEDILKRKQFWILSRLKAEIVRPPVWGDTVTVETWPKSVHRLFALRDYTLNLHDSDGEPIVRATSAWLLMDAETGRPLRPEKHLPPGPLRDNAARHAIDEPPGKLSPPEEGEGEAAEAVQVKYSDIDVNDHVNNSVYLRWLDDAVRTRRPELQLSSLELNFLKEAAAGIGVRIHSAGENTVNMEVRTEAGEPLLRGILRYRNL